MSKPVNGYLKFVAQIVATVLAAIFPAFTGDNRVDPSEWVNVGIVALGAVAVLGAGTFPAGVWSYTKTIMAAAAAGLVAIQSALTDGISPAEWFQIGLAALGAVGVYSVPGPLVVRAAEAVRP